jgi:mono/diheme cytochrome c family protein
VALAAMGVLVLTGLLSGWSEVQTWAALLTTAYGQALLIKLTLVGLILAFAAVNLLVVRRRVRQAQLPRLAASFVGLVVGELSIALSVLGVTSLLTSLPPPGQQPLPDAFTATRQAGSLRVTLTADPNWVGVSRYALRLADRAGREPSDVTSVTLTFGMRDMNMGRTTVIAAPAADQTYAASGFFVGMPGVSEIGVGIQRSDGPDESAVFDMDVPDLTQDQFQGLRPLLTGGQASPSAEHGQTVYAEHCQVCHGATGVGDGPAAAALLPPLPPDDPASSSPPQALRVSTPATPTAATARNCLRMRSGPSCRRRRRSADNGRPQPREPGNLPAPAPRQRRHGYVVCGNIIPRDNVVPPF